MNWRLSIRSPVYQELEKARRWYDKQRAGLGEEFLDCVAVALHELPQRPHVFPQVYRDVRRFPVRRFPYGIFYRIVEDELAVIAVLHGRQSLRRLRNCD